MNVGDEVYLSPDAFPPSKGGAIGIIVQEEALYMDDNQPMYLVLLKNDETLWVSSQEVVLKEVHDSKLYRVLA